MKIIKLVIILLLLISEAYGKEITGIVKDQKTGLPISYVNIGIPYKNIGTVSDENGRFSFVKCSKKYQ